MFSLFADSELKDLFAKIEQGIRLDYEDGLRLLKSNDILALGYMANIIRERKHGANTYFSVCGNKDALLSTGAEPNIATIIYGEILEPEHRLHKILEVRSIQDHKHCFTGFFPIAFRRLPQHPADTPLTTGFDDLRILASARILLDNIEHIQASVAVLGGRLAQVSLNFGVDELVVPDQMMPAPELARLIEKANRKPLNRANNYRAEI